MLFPEIIAVYRENDAEHINRICVQEAEYNVRAGGTYSNHCALKG
jgi:hypothetical protein